MARAAADRVPAHAAVPTAITQVLLPTARHRKTWPFSANCHLRTQLNVQVEFSLNYDFILHNRLLY